MLAGTGTGPGAGDARFILVKSLHVADSPSRRGWSCTDECVGAEKEGRTIFSPATCHPNILDRGYGVKTWRSSAASQKHIPMRRPSMGQAVFSHQYLHLPCWASVKAGGHQCIAEASPSPRGSERVCHMLPPNLGETKLGVPSKLPFLTLWSQRNQAKALNNHSWAESGKHLI